MGRLSSRRAALIALGAFAVFAAAVELACALGFVVNTTRSAPPGLWRTRPVAGPIARGAMAVICPPDEAPFRIARARGWLSSGPCPGGYERLLKRVAAIPGDRIEVAPGGVSVNGALLPNSAPLPWARDGVGAAALDARPRAVAEGELWLVSTYNPRSFDSRYFGPVPAAQVEGTADPVWIFPSDTESSR
jgi:conjugative transfer signal peptidase TraF